MTSPIDFVRHLELEGERLARLAEVAGPDEHVPTCPDWAVADLVDHLSRVHFRARVVVADRVSGPDEIPAFEPATDHAERIARFRAGLEDLADVLRATDPATEIWTWNPLGRTVEWMRRRQTHETVIHRLDAEYALGEATPIEPEALAADGVDEVLRMYVGRMPSWGSFEPDGVSVRLVVADGTMRWGVAFGRFHGTTRSGRTVEEEACTVGVGAVDPDAVVSGTASDLDRWLWGRGSIRSLAVDGDPEVAERLRALAKAKT